MISAYEFRRLLGGDVGELWRRHDLGERWIPAPFLLKAPPLESFAAAPNWGIDLDVDMADEAALECFFGESSVGKAHNVCPSPPSPLFTSVDLGGLVGLKK